MPIKRLAGDLAIWFFIYAELIVFGIFFLGYAFARSYNLPLFLESQTHLDPRFGALNTFFLITGSYFLVKAVDAISHNQRRHTHYYLLATLAMGSCFIVVKSIEFWGKYQDGIRLSSNTFFMFYWAMTFFHYMHVILGMIIIAAIWLKNRCGGYSDKDYLGVETGAAYWHMVDLVWVILFPLLYVL